MQRATTVLCLALAAAGLGFGVGSATAQQFSADMVGGPSSGREGGPSKIYVSNTKMRFEGRGRSEGAMIVDQAAGSVVVLMPGQKMYMDMSQGAGEQTSRIFHTINPNDACPQMQEVLKRVRKEENATWTCRRVGQETVNGRSAIKYEASSSTGERGNFWVDPQLKFLIKADGTKGGMELQNIKEGPQPASLFEIPADYHKFDMQQMMQQRGGAPRP
jgi:hypothetical protein